MNDDELARLNRITDAVIGAAITVHRALGPGYPEKVYEESMAVELELSRVAFERQKDIEVVYRDRRVGSGRMDFVVQSEVIVEIKAVTEILPVHEAQVLAYLRMTGHPVGLLLNFNTPVMVAGVRRKVNT